MTDDTLVQFEGGIGVIPVSSGVGMAATAEVVNRNIVREVQPAGQIWVIDKLDAKREYERAHQGQRKGADSGRRE